uniref:Uncharacterized protein n=1 Tax=Aegilops tauschii subsp. strangulata TaxID=200361 RepID=A0A453JKN9_AEGTS
MKITVNTTPPSHQNKKQSSPTSPTTRGDQPQNTPTHLNKMHSFHISYKHRNDPDPHGHSLSSIRKYITRVSSVAHACVPLF